MVGVLSRFLINSLSSATTGTVQFLFMLMIMLYSMYFFLIDGGKLLDRILYYLPLEDEEERRLLDKFSSVTRATLKGTAVIGVLQGGLAGLAFAVVGIPSALFWGTLMVVLSIIPGIGTGLIWVPAAVILIAGGSLAKGIGLAMFCGLVVGSIDNVLRPRLVGKDTQMPDLLILLGTLGGIMMFGVLGLILGPIVAALFVTVWEMYGVVFKDVLPPGRTPVPKTGGNRGRGRPGRPHNPVVLLHIGPLEAFALCRARLPSFNRAWQPPTDDVCFSPGPPPSSGSKRKIIWSSRVRCGDPPHASSLSGVAWRLLAPMVLAPGCLGRTRRVLGTNRSTGRTASTSWTAPTS